MNKMTTSLITATVIGGALMTQSAFGIISQNYLYLGFQNQAGGGTADYIINLGPVSSIVGGSSVVDLSSAFSLSSFNSVLGASSGVMGGVVGACNTQNPSDVYVTQLRTSNIGTPSVAGSSVGGVTANRSQDNQAFAAISSLYGNNTVPMGSGVLDSGKTWETQVEPAQNGSFIAIFPLNPDSPVSKTAVLYEDLWYSSSSTLTGSKPFVYQGYFTLDLTGSNPKLTFTPQAVPGSLPPPVFKLINKASGTVTLTWTSMTNHTYQLQYTASLAPTNWVNIGSAVLATNTMMTNFDTPGAATQRFYRLMAQ